MEGHKVSIGEFLNIAGVKLNTVKKNAEKIPGLKYENGDFDILSGTRYPGDFHRYKLENSADRRYVYDIHSSKMLIKFSRLSSCLKTKEMLSALGPPFGGPSREIGRASCRERV